MGVSCGTCGTRTPPPRPTCRNRLCRWYGTVLPRERLRVSGRRGPEMAPGQYPLARVFLLMLLGAAVLASVRHLGWGSVLVALAAVWLCIWRHPLAARGTQLLSASRSRAQWVGGLLLVAYLVLFGVLLLHALLRAVGIDWA